jgi:hypothetical protein
MTARSWWVTAGLVAFVCAGFVAHGAVDKRLAGCLVMAMTGIGCYILAGSIDDR